MATYRHELRKKKIKFQKPFAVAQNNLKFEAFNVCLL